jgi:hypothetical protein
MMANKNMSNARADSLTRINFFDQRVRGQRFRVKGRVINLKSETFVKVSSENNFIRESHT